MRDTLPVVSVAEASATSHRERKKQATRRALHDAAFELAESQGLAHTTIEAISERAGVAPRTFWAYFASKEDAVLDRDPEWPDRLRAALLDRPADEDALAALRHVLEEFLTLRLTDSKRSVRRQKLVRREPHLMAAAAATFDEIERSLVRAVADRLGVDPSRDLRPGLLVMVASGACRVAQLRWADLEGRRPVGELVQEAFDELAEGLEPLVLERRRQMRRSR